MKYEKNDQTTTGDGNLSAARRIGEAMEPVRLEADRIDAPIMAQAFQDWEHLAPAEEPAANPHTGDRE